MQLDPVMTIVNALTDKGKKPKKVGKEFKAVCPAHEDKSPSLQVGYGDKGAVVFCQAGCSVDAVMASLDLPMTAMFNEALPATTEQQVPNIQAPVPGAEATYFYCDETGRVLFRVEKHKNDDGTKKFLQARPDPVNPSGQWIYSLGNTRKVPYRLENVLAAAREEEMVFVVEGEKDVMNLELQGFVASCNPGGAGKFKREFAEHFAGVHVVLIPDNDEPGLNHMQEVATFLEPVARSVRMLHLNTQWDAMPEKADVSDWLAADPHHTSDLLLDMVQGLPFLSENKPTIFSAKTLMGETFPDIVMAVPGILAEGLNVLAGAPKIGKSWLSLGIAIAIAQGTPALGSIEVEQGDVLYLSLEDTPRRLQRRMLVMIGETEGPERLEFACGWPRFNAGGLDQLEDWLKAHPEARMVIIDTLAKVKGGASADSGSMYADDYAFMGAAKALADQYAVCMVMVHHTRKAGDDDPLKTIAGSQGLTGSADALMVLTRARGSDAGYLYSTGRDIEEAKAMLEFDAPTGQWLYIGKAEDVQEATDETHIIDLLTASEEPMGPKDVAEALDMKEGTAKWLLSKMVQEDKIVRIRRGQYTNKDPEDKGPTISNLPPGVTIHAGTQPPMPGLPKALQGPTIPLGPVAVDEAEDGPTEEEILAAMEDGFDMAEVDDDEDQV